MEEIMCYLLPASITTYMVNKQLKKISNQSLILIYLISTLIIYLIENCAFLLLNGTEAYKFFSVSFTVKYMLFAILIAFILGIVFSFVAKRFFLDVEVQNEKSRKVEKNKKDNKKTKTK